MKTALIAGQGALPRALADAMSKAGISWFARHLNGFEPDGVGPSRGFRIEQLGSFIHVLREDGVKNVVFAGRIARPPIDPAAIDAPTMPLVPRMAQAIASGDDAALRVVIEIFEEAGLAVIGAADVAPDLLVLPEVGVPSASDKADIARARAVLSAIGPVDVGQGVVVAKGQVLAVEALPGTDWMLASLNTDAFPSGFPAFARPRGGVFVKAPKPDQDRRIDLPTIGPETVRRAADADLNGIAIEASGVLVLQADKVTAIAQEAGLFLHTYQP